MEHIRRTYGLYHMQHINNIEPMISSSLTSTTDKSRSTLATSLAQHNVVNHTYEYHDSNGESTNGLLITLVLTRMTHGFKDFSILKSK